MATPSVEQQALGRALSNEEDLVVFYQPIHDAVSRRIVSTEALLRQRRATGEIREAGAITAGAEHASTRDLYRLDSFLMRTAFTDAARWQNSGTDVRLNVNLSPREFEEEELLERVTRLAEESGADPHGINLEITETSYIRDPKATSTLLQALKDLGVQLWLDDFGTGHSSMRHLHLFPVDGLKIPGAFVKDLITNRRTQTIARTLIRLAHDLGIRVIAEEIETEEQLALVTEWGCDLIQGFLYSRPVPVEELEAMLQN